MNLARGVYDYRLPPGKLPKGIKVGEIVYPLEEVPLGTFSYTQQREFVAVPAYWSTVLNISMHIVRFYPTPSEPFELVLS